MMTSPSSATVTSAVPTPKKVSSSPSSGMKRLPLRGGSLQNASFPIRLHAMLTELDKSGLHSDIVAWRPHGRLFMVNNRDRFIQEVLPGWFFSMTSFASFQRQLNLYGFARLSSGPDKGGYYNEMFLRGRPELAARIPRKRLKGTGPRKPATPEKEPDFYSMPAVVSKPPVSAAVEPRISSAYVAEHLKSTLQSLYVGDESKLFDDDDAPVAPPKTATSSKTPSSGAVIPEHQKSQAVSLQGLLMGDQAALAKALSKSESSMRSFFATGQQRRELVATRTGSNDNDRSAQDLAQLSASETPLLSLLQGHTGPQQQRFTTAGHSEAALKSSVAAASSCSSDTSLVSMLGHRSSGARHDGTTIQNSRPVKSLSSTSTMSSSTTSQQPRAMEDAIRQGCSVGLSTVLAHTSGPAIGMATVLQDAVRNNYSNGRTCTSGSNNTTVRATTTTTTSNDATASATEVKEFLNLVFGENQLNGNLKNGENLLNNHTPRMNHLAPATVHHQPPPPPRVPSFNHQATYMYSEWDLEPNHLPELL